MTGMAPRIHVRIVEAGRYNGLEGTVSDVSETNGDCLVEFWDGDNGGIRWFHAQDLVAMGLWVMPDE